MSTILGRCDRLMQAEAVSAKSGPPQPLKPSLLSQHRYGLAVPQGRGQFLPGEGAEHPDFDQAALTPAWRSSSTAALAVPAEEPISTRAISASSIRYSSKKPYLRPKVRSKSAATSKIAAWRFSWPWPGPPGPPYSRGRCRRGPRPGIVVFEQVVLRMIFPHKGAHVLVGLQFNIFQGVGGD